MNKLRARLGAALIAAPLTVAATGVLFTAGLGAAPVVVK